jgi:hypothetical protein
VTERLTDEHYGNNAQARSVAGFGRRAGRWSGSTTSAATRSRSSAVDRANIGLTFQYNFY